jgi:hypothetical protein
MMSSYVTWGQDVVETAILVLQNSTGVPVGCLSNPNVSPVRIRKEDGTEHIVLRSMLITETDEKEALQMASRTMRGGL